MKRRKLLLAGALAAAFPWPGLAAGGGEFELELSDEEWRRRLAPERYRVLRRHATEPPFSSPLDKEYRPGLYACAGCELDLYDSRAKFDSKTGWPSFTAALPDAVRTRTDWSLLLPRTEVHCRRCGGHLGHIFKDGPPPTGERHCLNGLALLFRPAEKEPAS